MLFEALPLPTPVCWHYANRGSCAHAESCRFLHSVAAPTDLASRSEHAGPFYWLSRMPADASEFQLLTETLEAHGFRAAQTPDEQRRAKILWCASDSLLRFHPATHPLLAYHPVQDDYMTEQVRALDITSGFRVRGRRQPTRRRHEADAQGPADRLAPARTCAPIRSRFVAHACARFRTRRPIVAVVSPVRRGQARLLSRLAAS